MNSLVFHFSEAYREEGLISCLPDAQVLDFTGLEGCCCYCDDQARRYLQEAFPRPLPPVRWLDSGDYHYLSHLLALEEEEPFHLVLLDNHPDNQEPAFGGVLSCGSWVKEMQEGNPMLRDVLPIGPPGCRNEVPQEWLDARRGERVYVSLDKDIMDRTYARTDWTQGGHTLADVERELGRVAACMEVVAVDICGELAPSKGATPEDLRINKETNCELYKFLNNLLK